MAHYAHIAFMGVSKKANLDLDAHSIPFTGTPDKLKNVPKRKWGQVYQNLLTQSKEDYYFEQLKRYGFVLEEFMLEKKGDPIYIVSGDEDEAQAFINLLVKRCLKKGYTFPNINHVALTKDNVKTQKVMSIKNYFTYNGYTFILDRYNIQVSLETKEAFNNLAEELLAFKPYPSLVWGKVNLSSLKNDSPKFKKLKRKYFNQASYY